MLLFIYLFILLLFFIIIIIVGDYKFCRHWNGQGSSSAKYPCAWCYYCADEPGNVIESSMKKEIVNNAYVIESEWKLRDTTSIARDVLEYQKHNDLQDSKGQKKKPVTGDGPENDYPDLLHALLRFGAKFNDLLNMLLAKKMKLNEQEKKKKKKGEKVETMKGKRRDS